MPNVEKITKQTENPFVNLYLVEGTNKVTITSAITWLPAQNPSSR